MKTKLFKRGFTLIELLVVIAIIGILTAIVTSNYTTAKQKSRDAKRISDIAQLQLTLELLFDRCNAYPTVDLTANGLHKALELNSAAGACTYKMNYFISNIPKDPNGNGYIYAVNNNGTDYVLNATLETRSTALNDDIDGTIIGVDCGNATDDTLQYCVQPK